MPISFDCSCERCGYNLRGLRPSGVCPECGDHVGHSMIIKLRRRVDLSFNSILLVTEALRDLVHDDSSTPIKNVPARLLCDKIIDLARRQTGSAQKADVLLEDLELHSGKQIGRIVEAMLDLGLLRPSLLDPNSHFDDLPLTQRAATPWKLCLRLNRSERHALRLLASFATAWAIILLIAWLVKLFGQSG